jgi:hypothetical protein
VAAFKPKKAQNNEQPQDFTAVGKDQLYRAKTDIDTFNAALQLAEDIHNPNRKMLYEVYNQVIQHGDLSAAMDTRSKRVLLKKFELVDDSGTEPKVHEEATNIFNKRWFRDFVKHAHETIYFGHTLLQLDPIGADGAPTAVKLIPRHHVNPHTKKVLFTSYHPDGIPYNEGRALDWLIEVCESEKSLGLLMKCAPYAIWNLIGTQTWSEFAEIYGAPRTIVYTKSDKNKLGIFQALSQMGSFGHLILNAEDRAEFMEAQTAQGKTVFESLCDYCDYKIARILLGQTMTMYDGASRAQGEVHMEVLDNITSADLVAMADIVNNKLLPILAKKLPYLNGLRFRYVDEINREAQMNLDKEVMKQWLLDPGYIKKTYGTLVLKPLAQSVSTDKETPEQKKDI